MTATRRRAVFTAVVALMTLLPGALLVPRVRNRLRRELLPVWTATERSIPYGPEPQQQLDFSRPRWPAARLRPVVVVIHGGGWRSGARTGVVDRVCRRYLQHGFVVANVGYRPLGVARASDDALRALDFVSANVARYGGDPARLAVTGESAGAQMALYAAFQTQAQVRAVVNFYGVTDLARHADALAGPAGTPEFRAAAERYSPLHHVRPGLCPVLSIHGTADPLVDPSHTKQLTERLRQAGVPAYEDWVDGGGHGFTEPQTAAAYRKVFEFLAAVLR